MCLRVPQQRSANSVRVLAWVAAAWLLSTRGGLPAGAQPGIVVGPGRAAVAGQQDFTAIDLPMDRTKARGIERAKDRIAEGEYSQALRFLDQVLAGAQDSFIPVGETGEYVGLKETAGAMIRDLPPEGRQFYEATFGPAARRKLDDALAAGDVAALRQVVRQYFNTPAGYEAAFLVAQLEADAGRHMSARILYDELLDTPEAARRFNPQLTILAARSRLALDESDQARELLSSLDEVRESAVQIAGREEMLSSISQNPLEWFKRTVGQPVATARASLDEWLTSRGNAARNGHAEGGLPHVRVRWEARLLSHPQFETIYDEFWAALQQRDQPLPTAGTPLAIGDTIISTTLQNVIAVDFRTGKRIWQTQPQRISEFEQLLNVSGDPAQFDTSIIPAQSFKRRIWDDYLYNSVSSDGERVFVIRDLRLPDFDQPDAWAMPFGLVTGDNPSAVNRLCAYDLATQGKLVWELDGAVADYALSGAYFLGAPVVVEEKLYCLAEIKSAIHLVTIDRRSGELVGLQQLAGLQNGINLDPQRRMQAVVPSYDSGMLVCPTGAGVVIGINLEKNALAWAYQYESNRTPTAFLRRGGGRLVDQAGQWIDGSAILAEGCAILAPPESDALHCLDLVTGKVRWTRDRGDGVYVAGVYQGRVLVVGLGGLTSLSLADGKPTWRPEKAALPDESLPSGRGFFSSGKYFLPVSNAEIVAIDLADGKIAERTRSRAGTVLGNLIAHQGAILSQNGKFLDCFDQIDVLREFTESRLAENPDDVQALRTLGELVYTDGQLARAIELLERAYALSDADPRTREVLGECLLVALEQDFASYRDRLPKLREIMDGSTDRMLQLLRIEAQGLLEMDEVAAAFEACMQFYDMAADKQSLVPFGNNHQASGGSWLRVQMADIWRQASADDRAAIVDRLTTTMARLNSDSAEFATFLSCFGNVGNFATAARMRQAERWAATNRPLAAQLTYLNYVDSESGKRAEAVAASAELLHKRGYERLAAAFDAELAGPLADVECLDGKTGRQWLEQWHTTAPQGALDWPYGKVLIDEPPAARPAIARRVQVPLMAVRLEQSDEVLGRANVFFSSRIGELAVRDSYGREIFRQILDDEERQTFDASSIYGVSRGNLLIVSMGMQITAIDTLSSATGAETVLWRKGTVRNSAIVRYPGQHQRVGAERPGSYRPSRMNVEGRWLGVLGPLTSNNFVYQDQRGLSCVDPLTGQVRWTRTDTPNACQLLGDDNVVIAVEADSNKAHVYSTGDGRSLGQVDIPRWREQLASRGTEIIAWRNLPDGQFELFTQDAISGVREWQYVFARSAQVDVAMNRYVAVVEPGGRYVIIDAADGQIIVDHQSEPLAPVGRVQLFSGSDAFVVTVQTTGTASIGRQHFNPLDYVAFDGQVMAFDTQSGKALWPRPAEVRQQALMLTQPVDAPVITFVGSMRRTDTNVQAQSITMLLLEKSSGRVLYAEDKLPQSPNLFAVTANGESQEVMIEMVSRLIRLKFTDAPRPPEPPATHEALPAEKEGASGLFRIIQQFGRGAQ